MRKEQIRVLLVQAYPNYEFRYLKNMLERDSTIQLNTVLQDADLEYAELDRSALRGFPIRREELFEYDVLLFGDVNPAYLSTGVMQNIADFVEKKGGGAAFIAGPLYTPLAYRHTPIAELLPVDLETATPPTGDAAARSPRDFGSCRPNSAWPARKCNSAPISQRRNKSGPICPSSTGCWKRRC